MYFESRVQAADIIANRLAERFTGENSAVVALSEGGVLVGAQIAHRLNCVLMYVLHENIEIPGENLDIGSVDENSGFTHNGELARMEVYEYTSEFHGYIEEQKRKAASSLNREISRSNIWKPEVLEYKNIILVNDGIKDNMAVDVALNLLKPINTKSVIICTPVADVKTVDHLHVVADELVILDIKSNFLDTDHYYGDNTKPSIKEAIDYVGKIIANWR